MTSDRKQETLNEAVLVSGYQHFNNGGVRTEVVKRVSGWVGSDGVHHTHVTMSLRTSISNMGYTHVSESPLFATSAKILHALADAVADNEHLIDPAYLAPINLVLEFPTDGHTIEVRGPSGTRQGVQELAEGESLYDPTPNEQGPADSSDEDEETIDDQDTTSEKFDLAQILEEHRISIFPEYESSIWTADVYDNESPVPTRTGHGASARLAVERALAVPKPQE
jgi:hypothetical protein